MLSGGDGGGCGGAIQFLARVNDMCDSEEGGKRRGERGDDRGTVGASLH